MKLYYFTLFLLWSTINLNAQSYYTVSGKIIDKKTQEALAFCNVGFPGKSLGTVSNEDGFFELHIPKDYANEKLHISYVGYFPFEKAVEQLKDTSIMVQLQPKSELLDEVLVLYDNEAFARKLVKKAGKKITKNYPTKNHQMQGFYRGIYKQVGEYVHLEEAAVSIDSKGYRRHLRENLVRIDQLRKTEDGRIKEWNSALFYWLLDSNGIYSILNLEPVKKKGLTLLNESGDYYYSLHDNDISNPKRKYNFNNYVFIKDPYNIDYYDYKVTAITEFEGEKVYVVEYNNPFRDKNFWGKGRIVISKSSLAVIDFEHQVYTSSKSEYNAFDDLLLTKHRVKYKKVGDEYLLQMIHLKSSGDDKSVVARNSAEEDKKKGMISQERTLIITNTFIGKRNYQSIKKSDALHRDTGITFAETPYVPSFWKNYNILLDAPLEQKVWEDLEKHQLDTKQFSRQ